MRPDCIIASQKAALLALHYFEKLLSHQLNSSIPIGLSKLDTQTIQLTLASLLLMNIKYITMVTVSKTDLSKPAFLALGYFENPLFHQLNPSIPIA